MYIKFDKNGEVIFKNNLYIEKLVWKKRLPDSRRTDASKQNEKPTLNKSFMY